MKKQHEKVLVAALAGMVIVSAAAFATQPAMAQLYQLYQVGDVATPPAQGGLGVHERTFDLRTVFHHSRQIDQRVSIHHSL